MQKPPSGPDEDEDDTAFGGLAPRAGPGSERRSPVRGHGARWLALAGLAAVLVLLWLYYGGRV